MGNFHCIPESCARVKWRSYLPPSIRYRYPNENWTYVDGDDYELEIEQKEWYGGQNPGVSYNYRYGKAIISGGGLAGWAEYTSTKPASVTPPITDVMMQISGVDYGTYEHWGFKYNGSSNPSPNGSRSRRYTVFVKDASNEWKFWLETSSQGHKVFGFEPADGSVEEGEGDCTLTITKNGEVVREETRDVCPEVEKLDCRLGDKQQIDIEKTPFLSGIEVLTFARDAELIKGIPFPVPTIKAIPPECLNIYRAELFDFFPDGEPEEPNEPVFGDFIQQICSADGCPPPEYEVICNCIEECPPGTCEVICGSHICCYDSTGKPVKEIPISDYFPDNTRGAGS